MLFSPRDKDSFSFIYVDHIQKQDMDALEVKTAIVAGRKLKETHS